MFNTETEKVVHMRPGHEGNVKNGAIDPLNEYIATTGTDGFVNIYKMTPSEESINVELVKKVKIFKGKT